MLPLINVWSWIVRTLIDQEATLSREAPCSSLGTPSLPKMATTSRTATTASSNSDLSAGKSSESRQEDEEEEEEEDLGEEG